MCLSIPAKIIRIDNEMATVDIGGASYEASIQLVPEAAIGDYVLIHTGLAIQIIDKEEAKASLKAFDDFESLNVSMDREERETGKHLI